MSIINALTLNAGTAYISNLNTSSGRITGLQSSNVAVLGSFNVNNGLLNIKNQNSIGIQNSNPIYTLDIIGDINYTGNLLNNGNIVITETTNSSLWSQGGNFIYYSNKVSIGSNTQNSYIFNVNGNSYFLGNLETSGDISCNNLTCSNNLTSKNNILSNLIVNTSAVLNCDLNLPLNNITCNNILGTIGNLSELNVVSGSGIINCKYLYVSDSNHFASNVIFEQAIAVYGKTNLMNDLNINTDKFQVSSASGNVNIYGNLTVGNSTKLNGTLTVSNDTTLNKLTVNNNAYFNGISNFNGNIYGLTSNASFGNLTVTNGIVGDSLSLNLNNVVVNPINQTVNIKYTTPSNDYQTGALIVNGGVGINGALNLSGPIVSNVGISVFDNVKTDGSIECSENLKVNTNCLIINNLEVGNNIKSSSITTGNIGLTGNCVVGGNLNIGQNLLVSNTITCNNDLEVLGGLNCTNTSNFSGGLMINSKFIPDTISTYQILSTYSGMTFTIGSTTILTTINLPSNTPGLSYKIMIGPTYTTNTNAKIVSNLPIFGMISNGTTKISITPNTYTSIVLSNCTSGDIVEIYSVYTSDSTQGYYIKADSSNTNGFTLN